MSIVCDDDFIRYQRQIALPEMGEEGQRKLMSRHVLMIGCGGLGSVVAPYLVGAGIGSLVIVDDDCVSLSNLHRQIVYRENDVGFNKAEVMKKQLDLINHTSVVRAINSRLGNEQLNLEIILADIVIDCSDNFKTRHQINLACFRKKTKLVSGAAIGWSGQLSCYDYQSQKPCYCCTYPDLSIEVSNCSSMGVLGPVVGVIGCMQAIEAIKALCSDSDDVFPATMTLFEGKNMSIKSVHLSKDPLCPVCSIEG